MPFSPKDIKGMTHPSSYIIFNLPLFIREMVLAEMEIKRSLCSKFRAVCLWRGFFLSGYIVSF